ncbi:MAG: hypothetical protein ACJAUV_001599 [Flavobacteriales bacterium]|jgi:hypothetical protein
MSNTVTNVSSYAAPIQQVGLFDSNSAYATSSTSNPTGFIDVVFPKAFPKGSKVIVQVQIQTFNGGHSPGIRIMDVNSTGFKCRMNELVGSNKPNSDGKHYEETFGWVAYAY